MYKKYNGNDGFSAIETVLVLVFVGVIGFVGWYVYHAKQSTNKVFSSSSTSLSSTPKKTTAASSTTSTASTVGGTSASAIQANINSISNLVSQNDSDLTAANSSLNDQSTFTAVP